MRRRAGGKLWKRVWPDVSPTDERTRQGRNKEPIRLLDNHIEGNFISHVRTSTMKVRTVK